MEFADFMATGRDGISSWVYKTDKNTDLIGTLFRHLSQLISIYLHMEALFIFPLPRGISDVISNHIAMDFHATTGMEL